MDTEQPEPDADERKKLQSDQNTCQPIRTDKG